MPVMPPLIPRSRGPAGWVREPTGRVRDLARALARTRRLGVALGLVACADRIQGADVVAVDLADGGVLDPVRSQGRGIEEVAEVVLLDLLHAGWPGVLGRPGRSRLGRRGRRCGRDGSRERGQRRGRDRGCGLGQVRDVGRRPGAGLVPRPLEASPGRPRSPRNTRHLRSPRNMRHLRSFRHSRRLKSTGHLRSPRHLRNIRRHRDLRHLENLRSPKHLRSTEVADLVLRAGDRGLLGTLRPPGSGVGVHVLRPQGRPGVSSGRGLQGRRLRRHRRRDGGRRPGRGDAPRRLRGHRVQGRASRGGGRWHARHSRPTQHGRLSHHRGPAHHGRLGGHDRPGHHRGRRDRRRTRRPGARRRVGHRGDRVRHRFTGPPVRGPRAGTRLLPGQGTGLYQARAQRQARRRPDVGGLQDHGEVPDAGEAGLVPDHHPGGAEDLLAAVGHDPDLEGPAPHDPDGVLLHGHGQEVG